MDQCYVTGTAENNSLDLMRQKSEKEMLNGLNYPSLVFKLLTKKPQWAVRQLRIQMHLIVARMTSNPFKASAQHCSDGQYLAFEFITIVANLGLANVLKYSSV